MGAMSALGIDRPAGQHRVYRPRQLVAAGDPGGLEREAAFSLVRDVLRDPRVRMVPADADDKEVERRPQEGVPLLGDVHVLARLPSRLHHHRVQAGIGHQGLGGLEPADVPYA